MTTNNNNSNHKNIARWGMMIVALGAMFYCYEYLLRIAPAAMMNQLMHNFSLTAQGFGLLIGLYYFAYSPMQAAVGIIYDMYGPRRIITVAVTLCAVGSLMFTVTHDLAVASVGRFIMGFGSAFGFVGALKLASVWLPSNRFAMATGSITALGMLTGMVGNIGMAHAVNDLGWESTLMIISMIGVGLIPIMWFLLRDISPTHKNTLSYSRLSYKETFINLGKIIKNPQIWISGFIGAVLYLSLGIFAELWGNGFVSQAYGYDHNRASFINSMIFFGWLVGSPLMGWISDKIRLRRPLLTIGCFMAAGLSLIFLYVPQLPWLAWCFIYLLFGIFCSTENITYVVGRENAHPALAGSAVSYINMLIMLGAMIFQPAVGRLLDMHWSGVIENGVRIYSTQDYRFALIIVPIGLFIGGLATFLLKETRAQGIEVRERSGEQYSTNLG